MTIIVCGGRDYRDEPAVRRALDRVHRQRPISRLVHGGARGADAMAGRWAQAQGVAVEVYAADWQRLGRAAGPRRNQQMLDEAGAELVVAFPGGRGTADMVRRARGAGVRVVLA